MALCLLLRLFVFRLLRLKRFSTLTLRCFDLYRYCWRPCFVWKECRSEERFSRNAETDLVCRLLLEKKKQGTPHVDTHRAHRVRADQHVFLAPGQTAPSAETHADCE